MFLAVENEGAALHDTSIPDGRLCAEPTGKTYRLREAIALSEELGRPLTEEEYEEFRLKDR